jgi:hypothetical protein
MPSLSTPAASARDSGAHPNHRLPIDESLDPIFGPLLAFGASQGLGTKMCAPSHQGSRDTPALPRGRGSVNRSSDKITHGA